MFSVKEKWSYRKTSELFIVVVAGLCLNLLPAPFNSSGITIFGCGAAVFAALRYPPLFAIPAVLIVSIPLWILEGSIVGKESLTLLPIVISLFGYQKSLRQVLTVGAGFWSLVFLPILVLEHALYEADQPSMMFSGVLVTWASGVLGLITGHFSYLVGNAVQGQQSDNREKVSLHFLFSYFFAGSFFVASMAVVYLSVSLYQKEQGENVALYMAQRMNVIEQQLTGFVSYHQNAISVAAQSLSPPYAITRLDESGTNQLLVLAAHYPEFLTFLIANDEGKITHSYPPRLINKAIASGTDNITYRAYYSEVMQTGNAYLSNVFQGRGFGNDPIVAMSAPIINERGTPIGIVEGSLSLKSFSAIDALSLPGFYLLLEDQKGEVIYASNALGLPPLSKAPVDDCGNSCDIYLALGPMQKEWLIVTGGLPAAGWKISYYFDHRLLLSKMSDYLLKGLVLLLLLSAMGVVIGNLVARIVGMPIRSLIRYIANFNPAKGVQAENLPARTLHIQELASLNDEFSSLEQRLINAFDALEKAREKEYKLNVELGQFNQSLEARIKEKTIHLAVALGEAKAASVAKTQFLANMSHEIRTPMNGIIGSCELMLESSLPEDARNKATNIASSANNLLMILDSILDWSKIESGKMHIEKHPVSVEALLEACYKLYAPQANSKGVALYINAAENMPNAVTTDGEKVSHILNQLVSNAIKFTQNGQVEVYAQYLGGILTISVADSGIGIARTKREDIFEQFEQADTSITRNYGGTGLGLTIAKGLVELLNGTIVVESEEGHGAKFSFRLPCDVAHLRDNLQIKSPSIIPSNIKVLLAEDNEINAEIVANMLHSASINCIRARNGEDAVEAAKRHAFDVILMDCQMPVMDGITAAKLIRQSGKNRDDVIIIALTANAFVEDKEACLSAGMNAHLSKPIKKQVLFDCIASQLAGI